MSFWKNYRRWLDDCLEEWNTEREGMVIGPRQYHQQSVSDDAADPLNLVEFSEAGDAYPHGIGGIGHVRNAVTPWEQSQHWCD